MARRKKTHLYGMIDALVLHTLSHGPLHGYGIARWLEDRTGGAVQVEEGSLYPALYRMEKKGLIEAEWQRSELDRPAKFYRLTARGRSQLRAEARAWSDFTEAVRPLLEAST